MGVAAFDGRSNVKSVELPSGKSISYLHLPCEKLNAPTIVFVHGFPLDHSMWNGQLPLQSVANLIMPDLMGFGKSNVINGQVSMRSMAGDIADLIDQLNVPKVIYCGLSMGGYIGWEFVQNYHNLLAGLICCNTRATADDEKTARGRRLAAAQVLKTGTNPVAVAMRPKLFAASALINNPTVVQSVVETICQTRPETIAAAQLAMSKRGNFGSFIEDINVPTLVIAGSEDGITPSAEMQEMAALIAGSEFHQVENSGHMTPLEQPDAFNSIVATWIANRDWQF